MADATGEDRDSKQGNLKEENEFRLEEKAKILEDRYGEAEAGVSNKIVGYVQNHFRLESLGRIEETNCAGVICIELKKLLDANLAEETYVQTVLVKLEKLLGVLGETGVRKLVQNDGLKLVVQSMILHPNYKPPTRTESGDLLEDVTAAAFMILAPLANAGRGAGRGLQLEQDVTDAIYSFLVSDFCMTTVIDAIWNVDAKWKRGGEVDDNLATVSIGMMLLAYIIDNVARHDAMTAPSPLELYAKILQQLEQKNVLFQVWYLLQKHIRLDSLEDPSDKNVHFSNQLVTHACFILTQNVGGADRPILKELLAETPQAMIDEILARMAEIDEHWGETYDDDTLAAFRMECQLAQALRQV